MNGFPFVQELNYDSANIQPHDTEVKYFNNYLFLYFLETAVTGVTDVTGVTGGAPTVTTVTNVTNVTPVMGTLVPQPEVKPVAHYDYDCPF